MLAGDGADFDVPIGGEGAGQELRNVVAPDRGGEAAAQRTPPPRTAIFLDAYDGKGDIPAYLRSRRFLATCHDVLADGGSVVCNCFNGASGSAARAAVERFIGELEAAIGPVFTVPVSAQPDSLVLVARALPQ